MFRHSSEVMVPYRTVSMCKTAYISVNKSAYLQALFFSFLGKKKKSGNGDGITEEESVLQT